MTWNESCLFDYKVLKETRKARALFLESIELNERGCCVQARACYEEGEALYEECINLFRNLNGKWIRLKSPQSLNSMKQTSMAYEIASGLEQNSRTRSFQECRRYPQNRNL